MSTTTQSLLYGFAYGEEMAGALGRSLGYRLLAPAEPEAWGGEVEALARLLQAAPYPDDWPPASLFASVLLEDGRRLVALARYGLTDHTASHRHGGLELVGVLGPGRLGVPSALAVYRWLDKRRSEVNDLRELGGPVALAEVLSQSPPEPPRRASGLPGRLWQEGSLVLAAARPDDPDRCLPIIEHADLAGWQWLPLVGPESSLEPYVRRGPLIAWRAVPEV